MEGLGQVGAQAPQQGQEEAPFTLGTAGQMNEAVIAKTGAGMKKPQPKAPQGQPASGHSSGLGKIDLGAIKAVEAGVIDPREVLADPGVSDAAKQQISRGLQLA